MRLSFLALAAGLIATPPGARAAPACAPPPNLAPAPVMAQPADQVVRGVTVAYYLLSLNWTPEWCRSGGSGATAQEMECARPFGFTLHGLWPNGAAPPYPRYCNPVGGLEAATVRSMFCRTPSPVLLQHEWQAHGSCGWAEPAAYFAQASKLFDAVAMPKIEAIPPGHLTAGAVRAAFIARNPGLRREQIFVQASRAGALSEVRLCYDVKYRPAACPGGNGAPDSRRMTLRPAAPAPSEAPMGFQAPCGRHAARPPWAA
jgi:ribonuclease T2